MKAGDKFVLSWTLTEVATSKGSELRWIIDQEKGQEVWRTGNLSKQEQALRAEVEVAAVGKGKDDDKKLPAKRSAKYSVSADLE